MEQFGTDVVASLDFSLAVSNFDDLYATFDNKLLKSFDQHTPVTNIQTRDASTKSACVTCDILMERQRCRVREKDGETAKTRVIDLCTYIDVTMLTS